MSQDPRDAWRRLQATMRKTGGGAQTPKGLFSGAAGLLLLGGGALVANNSLFNGPFTSILAKQELDIFSTLAPVLISYS